MNTFAINGAVLQAATVVQLPQEELTFVVEDRVATFVVPDRPLNLLHGV